MQNKYILSQPPKDDTSFNAVVEGSPTVECLSAKDGGEITYKLTEISLLDSVPSLNDGNQIYLFYGRASDFKTLYKFVKPGRGKNEKRIPDLRSGPGVVLPFYGGNAGKLSSPRSIIFSDGRVFMESKMCGDEAYISLLPQMLQSAKGCFNDLGAHALYRELSFQRNFLERVGRNNTMAKV